MPKFAGWVSGRLVVEADNVAIAERLMQERALELLITQAPVLAVRNLSLVITTESK